MDKKTLLKSMSYWFGMLLFVFATIDLVIGYEISNYDVLIIIVLLIHKK